MIPIQIGRANQRDLPSVCRVEDFSFSEPYPHELIAKLFRDNLETFLVAKSASGMIVGYCVASKDGNSVHLISIGVLREYRRRGIGTALLHNLLANLNPEVKELRLEVKENNDVAIRVYEALGFKHVESIENYYQDGSTALKMLLTRSQERTQQSVNGTK